MSCPMLSSEAEMAATCALFQLLDSGIRRKRDTFFQHHGVRARGDVFETFLDDGLCQNRRGGGAVARHIVGLGGHFADDLRAHILERIGDLDLLCDGHAVVGDQGSAE